MAKYIIVIGTAVVELGEVADDYARKTACERADKAESDKVSLWKQTADQGAVNVAFR